MTDQSSPAPLSVSLGIVASRALHWLRWQRRAGCVLAGEEPWRGRRGGLTGAECVRDEQEGEEPLQWGHMLSLIVNRNKCAK